MIKRITGNFAISRFRRTRQWDRLIPLLIALGLLATSLYIRKDVFLTPHLRGDQRLYIATAMKLANDGIRGYTLRGTDLQIEDDFFAYLATARQGDKGNVLRYLSEHEGVQYYDLPLLTTPPLLSYALVFSHGVFNPGERYSVPHRKWTPDNGLYTAKQYARKQLYAIIVPLLSSLLLVLVVFVLGRSMFGLEAATWAAFLLAICPTDILASQKIWADDLTALFVALSVLLFSQAKKHDRLLLAILAGICAGLAATAKPTGGIIVFGVGFYHLWLARHDIRHGRFRAVVLDKIIVAFFAAGLLALIPWYGLVTATYGKPWYRGSLALIADSAWFRMLQERSRYIYLVNIPAQTPVLLLAYYVLLDLARRVTDKDYRVLLFLWLFVYLYFMWGYKEERYLLPAIPAAALLSGLYLQRIRAWCDRRLGFQAGKILVILALVLCAVWSVPLAKNAVLNNRALIKFPL